MRQERKDKSWKDRWNRAGDRRVSQHPWGYPTELKPLIFPIAQLQAFDKYHDEDGIQGQQMTEDTQSVLMLSPHSFSEMVGSVRNI